MRIVVRDRRYGISLRGRYTLDVKIDYPSIPSDLPLTKKVLEQYRATKNDVYGYATFQGLRVYDIITILSAVKRQEGHVNVDRMGNCAFYKLDLTGRH